MLYSTVGGTLRVIWDYGVLGLYGTVWRLYGAVRVWMGLYRAVLGLNGGLLGCTELFLGRPWCCGGEGTTVSTRQRERRRDPKVKQIFHYAAVFFSTLVQFFNTVQGMDGKDNSRCLHLPHAKIH